MSIILFDPVEIVNLLRDECPTLCGVHESIDGDVDIESLITPLALVYTVADSSRDNTMMTGCVSQQHDNFIEVKIAVRKTISRNDRVGLANALILRDCQTEVMNAIVGFIPTFTSYAMTHISGRAETKGDIRFWIYQFKATDYLRK